MIIFSMTLLIAALALLLVTKPPLLICLLLIIAAALTGAIYGLLFTKWLCYSIILIFLGGMMVVFLYTSSITLNDKMMVHPQLKTLSAGALLTCSVLCPILTFNLTLGSLSFDSLIAPLFLSTGLYLVGFMVGYLLLALFTVVHLAQGFKGAILKSW